MKLTLTKKGFWGSHAPPAEWHGFPWRQAITRSWPLQVNSYEQGGGFTNKHRVLPMQIFTGKERDHLTHLFAIFRELQQWGFNHWNHGEYRCYTHSIGIIQFGVRPTNKLRTTNMRNISNGVVEICIHGGWQTINGHINIMVWIG